MPFCQARIGLYIKRHSQPYLINACNEHDIFFPNEFCRDRHLWKYWCLDVLSFSVLSWTPFIHWLVVGREWKVCVSICAGGGTVGGSGKCPWYWYTYFIGGRGVANANVLHPSYSGGQMFTPANHLGGKCPSCHFSWEGKCLGGEFLSIHQSHFWSYFHESTSAWNVHGIHFHWGEGQMQMSYILFILGGQMSTPANHLGGKCPLMPFFMGGQMSGAGVAFVHTPKPFLTQFSQVDKCLKQK